MGDKEKREGDLEEKEITDYEIELEIRKMRKAKILRKRVEDEEGGGELGGHQNASPPPAKKKKNLVNFHYDKGKRRRSQEIAEEFGILQERKKKKMKIEEKLECVTAEAAAEGVCDKSLPGEAVTTEEECRLQHFRQEISNHDVNGKPNILKIINNFEELSRKTENVKHLRDFKENLPTEARKNYSVHISEGEKKEIFEKTMFIFGEGPANGQKGGGGTTVKQAKPSSARKKPKKHNLHSNYRPITQYFKPTVRSESSTLEVGRKGRREK